MSILKIISISIALILPASLIAQENNQMGSYSQSVNGANSHINTYDEALHNHQVEKIVNEPVKEDKKKS